MPRLPGDTMARCRNIGELAPHTHQENIERGSVMGTLLALRGLLRGFKTYLVVGLWFFCLFVEKGLGMDVAGFDPGADWLETSFNYILVATGRAALGGSKVEAVLDRLLKASK